MSKKQVYNPVSGKFDLIDGVGETPQSYTALIGQSGIDNPDATVIGTNTLGVTVTWERVSDGIYRTNTLGGIGLTGIILGSASVGIVNFYRGGGRFFIETRDYAGVLTDGILSGFVRIEVPL